MSDVRLIQVPWYLGREHPDLSRGPGVLAEAIGGETVVVPAPEPSPVPNEVADSFEVIRSVSLRGRRGGRGRPLPARPRRQLLHLARDRGRGRPRRRRRLVRRARRLPHAGLDDQRVPRRDGARDAPRGRLERDAGTIEGLRPVPAENALLVCARDLEPTESRSRGRLASCAEPTRTRSSPRSTSSQRGSTPSTSTSTSTCIDPSVARANVLSVEGGLDTEQLEQALAADLEPLRDRRRGADRLRPEPGPREPRAGDRRQTRTTARAREGRSVIAAAWVCLFSPLAAAVLITLGGTRLPRRVAGYLATASVAVAFVAAVVDFFGDHRPQRQRPAAGLDRLDVALGRELQRRPQRPRRPAVGADDADRDRRRRADRRLLDRLHGRRGRGAPLLRLHGAVRLLDAPARPGREPAACCSSAGASSASARTC